MRKFDLSLRSSRSSYFATFRHQLTILSKTDALDEEKWLNRSEERFSRNAETDIVCRLLLEKKKNRHPNPHYRLLANILDATPVLFCPVRFGLSASILHCSICPVLLCAF